MSGKTPQVVPPWDDFRSDPWLTMRWVSTARDRRSRRSQLGLVQPAAEGLAPRLLAGPLEDGVRMGYGGGIKDTKLF